MKSLMNIKENHFFLIIIFRAFKEKDQINLSLNSRK